MALLSMLSWFPLLTEERLKKPLPMLHYELDLKECGYRSLHKSCGVVFKR